ncbi:MAG: cupin domain-containing protein [Acidimicrobiia bacterium]|nr:cupin domain-containing protein [Acidimicrobiia bacterium]
MSVWVVPCPDLDQAMASFTEAGFDVHSLGPADNPSYAVMFASHPELPTTVRLDTDAYRRGRREPFLQVDLQHGPVQLASAVDWNPRVLIDCEGGNGDGTVDPVPTEPVFSAAADDTWIVGRAGMRYRDLLPGRWGGRFIASHIHIPNGGPVPDYVHYHDVEFQLIFCHRGWVRVVYEDQGEPFVLHPGDAVLQAPGIRHRVLEASDDLYVVEISSPAQHPTYIERRLVLPNGLSPGRRYGGQNYVHFVHDEARRETVGSIEFRSLGLESATGGRYSARILQIPVDARPLPSGGPGDFSLLVVLDGELNVELADGGRLVGHGQAVALDADSMSAIAVAGHGAPAPTLLVQRLHSPT